MITMRHALYRRIRGSIIHVTWIGGLEGILRDKEIRANPDHLLDHSASLRPASVYACQKLRGVALLDFKSVKEQDLFDPERSQHWSGVFTTYHPSIVLILSNEAVEGKLVPWSELRSMPEKSLFGEACHRGNISLSAVTEGIVLGAARRMIYSSSNLFSVLEHARQVCRFSRRRRSDIFSLLSQGYIEPGAPPHGGPAESLGNSGVKEGRHR